MSVASKLLALDAVKDAIKAAIQTNLGRTIGASVRYDDYKDYILPPVAWMPDPLWPSLTDIADGQIGMIVRDRDDLGVAARCAFTITAKAAYVVDWGDGTAPETVASTVMADHTYTLGAGTADSKGTTTFKVRISSTGTIQRIQMASNVTGGVVDQTVQRINYKAAETTSMLQAFRNCTLLEYIEMVSIPLCTTMAGAFTFCSALQSVGNITATACTSFGDAFSACVSLRTVGDLTLNACTSLSFAFNQCENLRSVGAIYAPLCTSFTDVFTSCRNLQSVGSLVSIGSSAISTDAYGSFYINKIRAVIDFAGAKLSRVGTFGTNVKLSGITGLTFNASSAFGGSSPQINVSYTMMDRTALVALFNLLPTLVGKTINITGCIGTADLTVGDRTIATGKGWTITG